MKSWVEEHEISNQKTNHDKSKELWKKPGVEKITIVKSRRLRVSSTLDFDV